MLSSSSKGFALVKTEVEVGEGKVEIILDSIEERQMRLLQSVRMAELEIGNLTGLLCGHPTKFRRLSLTLTATSETSSRSNPTKSVHRLPWST